MTLQRSYSGSYGPDIYNDIDTLADPDGYFPGELRKAFITSGSVKIEGDVEVTGDIGVFGATPSGQASAIANPDITGGQLQTAVIAILDALRAFGFIAT